MARDRPLALREGAAFFTVARGPVPRDRCMARETRLPARVETCEGPNPTMKRAFCRRGPGRRAAILHRDREVSPTGENGIVRGSHETILQQQVRKHPDLKGE